MRGERARELFPLVEQPRDLLFGRLALRRDRAHPVAVGVEPWIGEHRADLFDPPLQRLDLALDVFESRSKRFDVGADFLLLEPDTLRHRRALETTARRRSRRIRRRCRRDRPRRSGGVARSVAWWSAGAAVLSARGRRGISRTGGSHT